jgi:hypothetical protein
MQEWIRGAIRSRLLPEGVDPTDPIFRAFPLVRGKGRKVDVAEHYDEFLYGPLRGSSSTPGPGTRSPTSTSVITTELSPYLLA